MALPHHERHVSANRQETLHLPNMSGQTSPVHMRENMNSVLLLDTVSVWLAMRSLKVQEPACFLLECKVLHTLRAKQYHWTDNYYIASRYFPELVMSDVM